MSSNLESVQVDQTYQDAIPISANLHEPASTLGSRNDSRLLNKVKIAFGDPICIELIVVLVVIVSAVLSSELGIHAGKSYA